LTSSLFPKYRSWAKETPAIKRANSLRVLVCGFERFTDACKKHTKKEG